MSRSPQSPPPAAERPRRGRRRRLAGLRAIVTGASSGVGRAVARELARRGVHLLATARREEPLAELAAEPPAPGGRGIEFVAGDVCLPEVRSRLVETAADRLGGIDIVVAAAGGGAIGSFAESTPDTLRRIMEVDFFAPAELIRESLPLLRRGRDPAVVLVGSILGCHPLPLHAEYCAAKAAVRSLAGTLRMELAADGIDVLLASLGPTESEFWNNLVSGSRPRWSRGRQMSAARTAAAIAAGLERRSTEILPGLAAKGFFIAARFFPSLIDAVVKRRMDSDRRPSATR